MKEDQLITIVFLLVGIISGFVSGIFENIILAGSLPLLIYLLVFLISTKFIQTKKIKLLYGSFVTFVLVWLVIWIILYNV